MEEIKLLEDARKNKAVSLSELGIVPVVYWAYTRSKERGLDLIDFDEIIWDDAVSKIVESCKEYGIDTITISTRQSSMPLTLSLFTSLGCTIIGTTKVKWLNEDDDSIPAIVIKI